jgi:predicted phage tail protein
MDHMSNQNQGVQDVNKNTNDISGQMHQDSNQNRDRAQDVRDKINQMGQQARDGIHDATPRATHDVQSARDSHSHSAQSIRDNAQAGRERAANMDQNAGANVRNTAGAREQMGQAPNPNANMDPKFKVGDVHMARV